MIDEYWSGQVNRISSEAPVPIIKIDENRYRVGGAGNVAMNLRALGVNARLVSCIGKDKEISITDDALKLIIESFNNVVEKNDSPSIRGMINRIPYLLKIEEI